MWIDGLAAGSSVRGTKGAENQGQKNGGGKSEVHSWLKKENYHARRKGAGKGGGD
jgi:hypothetical protein